MADQTVRIENPSDSGSPARVAYDLWSLLRYNRPALNGAWKEQVAQELELYNQCRRAAIGGAVDTSKLT